MYEVPLPELEMNNKRDGKSLAEKNPETKNMGMANRWCERLTLYTCEIYFHMGDKHKNSYL